MRFTKKRAYEGTLAGPVSPPYIVNIKGFCFALRCQSGHVGFEKNMLSVNFKECEKELKRLSDDQLTEFALNAYTHPNPKEKCIMRINCIDFWAREINLSDSNYAFYYVDSVTLPSHLK